MNTSLGHALTQFHHAFQRFQEASVRDPRLRRHVLNGAEEWVDLLSYKLAPHLAGEGCIVAAVAGGTNSGKSTVFNLLLGRAASPVLATAAATRFPILAGNRRRVAECLEGKLVPEFTTKRVERPEDVTDPNGEAGVLFVVQEDSLPDKLVLLDTPDVDSIDTINWQTAEHIRAAGDVLIAVLTGEKYKDERVVRFFREARMAGRVVAPLMNKADPRDDFAVARRQLTEFVSEAEIESGGFLLAHDFRVAESLDGAIVSAGEGRDLRAYLEDLEAGPIKQRVYQETVRHFARQAGEFLDRAEDQAATLQHALDTLRLRAREHAKAFDPIPGTAVGGLFHEFVQSKRGLIRRGIGAASHTVYRGAAGLGRRVSRSFRGESGEQQPVDAREQEALIRRRHAEAITRITRALVAEYHSMTQDFSEPAKHLIESGLSGLDEKQALDAVLGDVLLTDNVSACFRAHAHAMLERWWNESANRRRALEAMDSILAVAHAAAAVPLSIYTAGIGVAETFVVTWPMVEQFTARVIEHQFADRWFDFLSPWKIEQQERLARALEKHVGGMALGKIQAALETLSGEEVREMREAQVQCLKA
ncbi:MAG: GTPase [Candidatus Hydrogenedentota bacterium]